MTILFKTYLKRLEADDTPAGRLAKAARADRNFPDIVCWEELESHLERSGASPAGLAAGRAVWEDYVATTRRPVRRRN